MGKYAKFFISFKLILKRGNKILILTETKTGFFDIPGGRVDEREAKSPIQKVLKREINEELGSSVRYKIINPAIQYRHYDKFRKPDVLITAYEAEYLSGKIKLSTEHQKYEWVDPQKFNFKNWKFSSKEERLVFEEYFKKLKGRKNN